MGCFLKSYLEVIFYLINQILFGRSDMDDFYHQHILRFDGIVLMALPFSILEDY